MGGTDGESHNTSFVFQSPNNDLSLINVLLEAFENQVDYSNLRILAATVSRSGVKGIWDQLRELCQNGGYLTIFIGLSMGPELDAIRRLRSLQDDYPGQVSIQLIKNGESVPLFHPKVYWFQSEEYYYAVVGSPNWSGAGLSDSVEAMTVRTGGLSGGSFDEFHNELKSTFAEVGQLNRSEDTWGSLYPPTEDVLEQLEKKIETTQGDVRPTPKFEIDIEPKESLWPLNRTSPELVMELNKESRWSQVSPPNKVWHDFFAVNPYLFKQKDPDLPMYNLRNVKSGETIHMPVVDHDHQGTIEIPEASQKHRDDPSKQRAFLVFRRTGQYSFDYGLYLEHEDNEAEEIGHFLDQYGYEPGQSSRLTYINRGK